MPQLKKLIAILRRHYGEAAMPPARRPFELVMRENACYLLPDERRSAVFERPRSEVGLNAAASSRPAKIRCSRSQNGRHAPGDSRIPLARDRTHHRYSV